MTFRIRTSSIKKNRGFINQADIRGEICGGGKMAMAIISHFHRAPGTGDGANGRKRFHVLQLVVAEKLEGRETKSRPNTHKTSLQRVPRHSSNQFYRLLP